MRSSVPKADADIFLRQARLGSPRQHGHVSSIEAVIAIHTFLEEFYTRFQNHYFAQMHRYYHDRPDAHSTLEQMRLPLPDPSF